VANASSAKAVNGVQRLPGTPNRWIWTCIHCQTTSKLFSRRDKARESYRTHRREICTGEPGVVLEGEAAAHTSAPVIQAKPALKPEPAAAVEGAPFPAAAVTWAPQPAPFPAVPMPWGAELAAQEPEGEDDARAIQAPSCAQEGESAARHAAAVAPSLGPAATVAPFPILAPREAEPDEEEPEDYDPVTALEDAIKASYEDAKADSHERRLWGVEMRLGIRPEQEPSVAAAQAPRVEAEPGEEEAEGPSHPLNMTRAKYLRIAAMSDGLTGTEFRVLWALLDLADSDFTNCFPSLKRLAKKVGGMSTAEAAKHKVRALVKKGWIERVPMASELNGRFSSNGYRFCIPPDEIVPGHAGWKGPKRFDRRDPDVRARGKRGRGKRA
jgi:hypothetical protein